MPKFYDKVDVLKKPGWLKIRLHRTPEWGEVRQIVEKHNLHTICSSGRCPNQAECWSRRTATFMILGDICTRGCRFCATKTGRPLAPDAEEPRQVAESVALMKLRYVVVTSVTRDDLDDGGAAHFAATITRLRAALPAATVEVLIPDFRGDHAALRTVMAAAPHIVNHNVETPPAHYARIRPQADYRQSLELLRRVKAAGGVAKSGLMVGLGENVTEVEGVLADLADCGCDIVTIGQYMRPSRQHPPVERYVHPDTFESFAACGRGMGIPFVFSAPLVRSSYNAESAYNALCTLRREPA